MYTASPSFEGLPADEKINYLFDLAYDVSARTKPDEYTEKQLEALQDWSVESLDEFALRVMSLRHGIHAYDINRPNGLHVASPYAATTGTFNHFQRPELTFTIDSITGFDTRGYNLYADRLSIIDSPLMEVGNAAIIFERMNHETPDVSPLRPNRHAAATITALCVQLETIERTP